MNNLAQTSKFLLWNPFHKFACQSILANIASISDTGVLVNGVGRVHIETSGGTRNHSTSKRSLRRHFDKNYCERLVLRDGSVVTLRLVRPTDHDLWVDCFKRISPESRYLRFCSVKKSMSEKEIQYFTIVDQEKHFCIVAVKEELDGDDKPHEIGLGVGRFICSREDPSLAEPAIVVMDDYQNHGLGYVIALRLVAAAKERNVNTFEATILGSNTKVVRLMKDLSPNTKVYSNGMDMVVTSELPFVQPDESWSHKHEINKETPTHDSIDYHLDLNDYLRAKY
mmetsp:Transcript_15289/g.23806  ORF Transcript_15289/g.23806 Transcript_15289/m.23806 type:complete len:282 (-) Transcript_15289:62-907(-)|eukprot:CAMPEP_0195293342 /NCGR_PEP_ID=MMETSP0707-20130614/12218_1 /TAXON_ID=33640 /ORGANISM="Asterionellopsis glacialis, Strain CCMP134" /LENGTH=281 /DNA_ID=CAMNT_0040354033 /DNA_START=41 /DNA_END=886 /DNA_ORIENTATION=+